VVYKTSRNQSYERIGFFSAMLLTKQRFEHLEIWEMSVEIANQFCNISEQLEKLQLNKFSEYIKDICMRISNLIAEAADNNDKHNIHRLLMNAHFLILESENMIMILYEQQLVELPVKKSLWEKIQLLDELILELNQQPKGKHILN